MSILFITVERKVKNQLISNSASDTFTSHTDEEFEDGNVQYGDDDSELCVVIYMFAYILSFSYVKINNK